MKRERLTVSVVGERIREKRGNLSSVAKSLGWSRSHVRRFVFKHAKLVEEMEQAREEMKDNVVSEFYRACLDENMQGHVTAMIFFLKTQCGWVENQNINVTADATQVHVYLPDNGRGD